MLSFAILIGIYSYVLLGLGLAELLHRIPVILVSFLFLIVFFLILRQSKKPKIKKNLMSFALKERVLFALLIILAFINLVGALGPEHAFDAVWYHLTFPKLYISYHKIFFLNESLFYYSLMPKLTEMLFIPSLMLWNEIGAKLIHYLFGIITAYVVFNISRLYLSRFHSLLVTTIFYSNLVVGWLSITAYSDLSRAFYESMALFYFLRFVKERKTSQLIFSAVMLGFAICTKLISFGTIPIFLALIFITHFKIEEKIRKMLLFLAISLVVPLPWFAISYLNTGNPFYPLFTHLNLRIPMIELLNPFVFIRTFINTFIFSADPLNPFYILILPLVILGFTKLLKKYPFIVLYSFLSYIVWYFTSQTGGTRFLTSYLPAYTIMGVLALEISGNKKIKRVTFFTIIVLSLIAILYRGTANLKYIPYITGYETKQEFLMKNLNFDFGDFYDENNHIKKIVGAENVLLINMHNLYYVDFAFVLLENDARWGKKFILIHDADLPKKFQNAKQIYRNDKTKVRLYKL